MTDRKLTIWVVDDDASVRWVLEKALLAEGMITRSFEQADELLRALEGDQPDVIITDIRMPGLDGIEMMDHLVAGGITTPVIVMTAHADLDSAVAAYKG